MIIRRKLFSEKKMSREDRAELRGNKLLTKSEKRHWRTVTDPDSTEEERKEAIDKLSKPNAIYSGISGAIVGGMAGAIPGYHIKNPKVGSAVSAAGGVAGAIGGYVGMHKVGKTVAKRDLRTISKAHRQDRRHLDLLRVANGELAERDYIEKYGYEKDPEDED